MPRGRASFDEPIFKRVCISLPLFNEGATSSASHGEGAVSVTPPVRLDDQEQGGGSTAGQQLPGQVVPPSWRGYCRCTGVAPLQKECRHSADDSPSVRV